MKRDATSKFMGGEEGSKNQQIHEIWSVDYQKKYWHQISHFTWITKVETIKRQTGTVRVVV